MPYSSEEEEFSSGEELSDEEVWPHACSMPAHCQRHLREDLQRGPCARPSLQELAATLAQQKEKDGEEKREAIYNVVSAAGRRGPHKHGAEGPVPGQRATGRAPAVAAQK